MPQTPSRSSRFPLPSSLVDGAAAAMSVSADSLSSPEEGSTTSPVSDGGTAVEQLTDDLLVEILSRVPAKSLCRFKCVSDHWLSLIDHPGHRKRLPQTLAGFLYTTRTCYDQAQELEPPVHLTSVSGRRRDITFAFLSNHPRFDLYDYCNGLILGCWWDKSNQGTEYRYFVFNPATDEGVSFPHSRRSMYITPRLAFDPALSSHFRVFDWVSVDDHLEWYEQVEDEPDLAGVEVYSSENGGWVYKEKTWNKHIRLDGCPETVFLNGYMHFLADERDVSGCLAVVDMEGETWMNFPVPGGLNKGFIQQSQGRLNYANFRKDEDGVVLRLVVYVLDSYQSKEWILTHSVETSYLFGGLDVRLDEDFYWIAFHPDCNLVFFIAGCDNTLLCYNMDRRQVKVISNLEGGERRYLPYVPLYAELQSLRI